MDVVLHELVGPLQQLGRDDYNTGGAVTDLLVLQLRDDDDDDEYDGGGDDEDGRPDLR